MYILHLAHLYVPLLQKRSPAYVQQYRMTVEIFDPCRRSKTEVTRYCRPIERRRQQRTSKI